MARPELGNKRRCLSCDTKFYDLNRDPVYCPSCGTIYQAPGQDYFQESYENAIEDSDDLLKVSPDLISLTDVDSQTGVDPSVDGIEEDVFIEEDVTDDEVSDLIDKDLDKNQEE